MGGVAMMARSATANVTLGLATRGGRRNQKPRRTISRHAEAAWLARRETGDADVDATDERTLAKYKYLAVYGEDARDRADVEAPAAPA